MPYGKSLYFWMHRLLLPQTQSFVCWEISCGFQIFPLSCHVLQLFSSPSKAWKNVTAGFRAAQKPPQSPRSLLLSTAHLPPSSIYNEVWEVGKLQDSHLQVEITPQMQVTVPSHLCSAVLSCRREHKRPRHSNTILRALGRTKGSSGLQV